VLWIKIPTFKWFWVSFDKVRIIYSNNKRIPVFRSSLRTTLNQFLNPLVPRVAYLLHELLGATNSKNMLVLCFFPSVECLLHCKVIFRYRNIVIVTFCGYLPFSRKCQPPWNMSGENITDVKIKLYDHTDNYRFRI
jgi:hypothetical protein